MELLPEDQRILLDVLRHIVLEELPPQCREKMTYNVPFFYGKRRICLLWPARVPGGGIRSGVLFGFCYGHRLPDEDRYLDHGNNKQIYYKIYHTPEEIDEPALRQLLKEALLIDKQHP